MTTSLWILTGLLCYGLGSCLLGLWFGRMLGRRRRELARPGYIELPVVDPDNWLAEAPRIEVLPSYLEQHSVRVDRLRKGQA